jgi:hypothetical protein
MKRNRGYYRQQRTRAINRKKGILKRIGGDEYVFAWAQNEPNRLSKGKIHCSCRMCRKKSYDGISHSDAKKLLRFM